MKFAIDKRLFGQAVRSAHAIVQMPVRVSPLRRFRLPCPGPGGFDAVKVGKELVGVAPDLDRPRF